MTRSRSRSVAAIAFIVALALGASSSAVLTSEPHGVVSRAALVVNGPVMVRHGVADFVAANVGDIVAAGDMIRTGTGASAEITYFDGSSVRLEADSEIVVASLGHS